MVTFLLNNQIVESSLPKGMPLVDVIRQMEHLPGTKIGCREGDCGACTVLMGELIDDKMVYKPITSCITPFGNAQGKHIVTIEGLNLENQLTPIQQAFLDKNATQCGFCTPGFIVSLISFVLSENPITYTHGISAIDGNICRCTGYKSIERAIKVIVEELSGRDSKNIIKWLVEHCYLPAYFEDVPAKMRMLPPASVSPKSQHMEVMGGGTDLLVQRLEDMESLENLHFITLSDEYKKITRVGDTLEIGAAVTTEQLKMSEEFRKLIPASERFIKLISSTQIRSIATVAGNFVNASPIGDLTVMFLALEAELKTDAGRIIPLSEFIIGYKKTLLNPLELVTKVIVKIPQRRYFYNFEKVSKREYLDIATVNSAMKIECDDDGKILHAVFVVGGVGPKALVLKNAANVAIGKPIDMDTYNLINNAAQSEITPRSRAEYKRALVRQELFAHFLSIAPDKMDIELLKGGK